MPCEKIYGMVGKMFALGLTGYWVKGLVFDIRGIDKRLDVF